MLKLTLKTRLRMVNLWLIFGLGVSLLLVSSCGPAEVSQTNTAQPVSNAGSKPAGYDGPFQADIFTKGRDSFDRAADVETAIRNAKLEEIWLRFPADANAKQVELAVPKAAMELLNNQFKGVLKHRLIRPGSAQERVDADRELINVSESARTALWEIPIDAPDGKRNFSQAEADKLISFVVKKADEIKLEFDQKS